MMLRLALVLFLVPLMGLAEPYPQPRSTFVNDFAELLDEDTEARIETQLKDLRSRNGIEMTVVTISSRAAYDPSPSIESFATKMFNGWGIGNASRNDGILVLVAVNDREMRLELGSGFGREWDAYAEEVVDDAFLPFFREDRYARGIEDGTRATIYRIADPFAADTPPPAKSLMDRFGDWLIFAGFGLAALLMGLRRRIGNLWTRTKRCPNCRQRGMRRKHETLNAATKTNQGHGMRTVWCQFCDWRQEESYTISRISSSSSGSFGGGSSSGGGASGRW